MIETPILVEDPGQIFRTERLPSGSTGGANELMFWRAGPPPPPYNLFALQSFKPKTPGEKWELYRDTFTSVIPIVEVYSQQTAGVPIPTSFNFLLYWQKSGRIDMPEEMDFPHVDHAEAFFQFQRRYAAQLVGYTVYYPDLCDDPWLEQVHRPADPETAWYPFRQPAPVAIPGQQFNLFFNQPRAPVLEAEQDTIYRRPDLGVLLPYVFPVVTLVMPNLIGMNYLNAVNLVVGLQLVVTNLDAEDTVYPIQPQPQGTVIFQWPLAGTPIPIGQPVIIIYSSGLMNLPAVGDSVANPVNVVVGPNSLN